MSRTISQPPAISLDSVQHFVMEDASRGLYEKLLKDIGDHAPFGPQGADLCRAWRAGGLAIRRSPVAVPPFEAWDIFSAQDEPGVLVPRNRSASAIYRSAAGPG